jgi:hypothetical protein
MKRREFIAGLGAGFVDGSAGPGGNVTGFMTTEFSVGGKRNKTSGKG